MNSRDIATSVPQGVFAAAAFALTLVGAWYLFLPATSGPFVFDDFPNLANLTQLGGAINRESLGQYLAAFTGSPGRPLAALSFLIEDSAWPTDPEAFKRNNVLWHLLCGVLVFALSVRLARTSPRTAPNAIAIGLLTMAAWVIHPMQLSGTMLVVQRMNILSGIFVLAGLLMYASLLQGGDRPGLLRVIACGTALGASAILALLCKENGVLIFAYATVLNATLLRSDVLRFDARARRLLVAGCAAPIVALGVAAFLARTQIGHGYLNRTFTLGERLLTESRILLDYLHSILLPRIGGQGVFHDDYPISRSLLQPPATALAVAAIAALLLLGWRTRKSAPLLAFAIGWFFGGHLIESTVWPLELYFEHRNYLPMIGPLFAVAAWAGSRASRYRRTAWMLCAAWLGLAAALTAVNARTWGDRGSLATVWRQESPQSVRAVQMLAGYHYERGERAEARRVLVEGSRRIPDATELAMQVVLLDCYTRGITPSQYRAMLSLARYMRFSHIVPEIAGHFGEEDRGNRCKGTLPENGFIRLGEALAANPRVRRNGSGLAHLYVEMSKQSAHDRDLNATIHYLDAAFAASRNPMIARNQAIYLLSAGLPEDAMRYLTISEQTPQPRFKAWLRDLPAMNRGLWRSAHRMQQAQAAASENPSRH